MTECKEIFKAYNRFSVEFDHGKDMYLYDTAGKEYLDFGSGIGVMVFGYANEKYTQRINEQVGKLMHTSNLYYHKPLAEASKKVVAVSKMKTVFFTNSGAEAVEGAIKAAKKYRYNKKMPTGEIIAMQNSFHGRTMGALSVTGTDAYREPFYPLVETVKFADFNDLKSVEALITDKTLAIILEPLQGEGGLTPATEDFLKGVKRLCEENDIVLIFDEIQCGFYRSGEAFVWQKYGVEPDIITLAKALGAGFPVGAFAMNKKLTENSLVPGDHGTTYGGNPLATTAVCASLDIMEELKLGEHVRKTAPYFEKVLEGFVEKYDFVKERKGMGFMQGIILDESIKVVDIIVKALEKGLVILSAHGNMLRLLPPLIATETDIDRMKDILDEIFSNCG